MRSQEKEAEAQRDIETLKKDQERLFKEKEKDIEALKQKIDCMTVEKVQLWDNRVRLEKVVFPSCQQIPRSTEELDAEAK